MHRHVADRLFAEGILLQTLNRDRASGELGLSSAGMKRKRLGPYQASHPGNTNTQKRAVWEIERSEKHTKLQLLKREASRNSAERGANWSQSCSRHSAHREGKSTDLVSFLRVRHFVYVGLRLPSTGKRSISTS